MAKTETGYAFRFLEVHTLHVRDFGGERLIQSLGRSGDCDVSTACAQSELRAVLLPMRRILRKCLPFLIVLVIGTVLCLTLTLRDEMFAFRALGPMAVFCGAAGMFSETKKILEKRNAIRSVDPEKALERSAWQCFLRDAPKKYEDNDITYIPIEGETLKLDADGLALEYSLLPAISRQAFEAIHHKESF